VEGEEGRGWEVSGVRKPADSTQVYSRAESSEIRLHIEYLILSDNIIVLD